MLLRDRFEARLAHRILLSVGATACLTVACGDDSGSGGGGGGTSTTGAGPTGGTTATGTMTTSTATGNTTTGTTTSTASSSSSSGSSNSSTGQGGGGMGVERCWVPVLGDPNEPCPTLAEAPIYYPCTDNSEFVQSWLDGPELLNGLCCYDVVVGPPNDPNCAVIGRPLVVEGRAARAAIARGKHGWAPSRGGPSVASLDHGERARLARAWADDAAYEHASVASFSKLALELMAFGAPADLVRSAHEAALDEIRHAELGFALASAYAGEPLAPDALPEARHLDLAVDLPTLAAAAVREGCVGETLAALVASAQHDVATDEAVRGSLAVVREDEARHAELAWRLVAWALRAGGEEVRAAVAGAFEGAARDLEASTAEDGWSNHAHGRLSDAEARAARLRGLHLVVRPALENLLRARAVAEA